MANRPLGARCSTPRWIIAGALSLVVLLSHPGQLQANEKPAALPAKATKTGFKLPPQLGFVSRALGQLSGDADPNDIGLLIYPTIAYAPETEWDFGISTVYVYYADNDPKNRLSELSAFVFVTQAQQYGMMVEHMLYSSQNKWFFFGKASAQSFPMQFFGIGAQAGEDPIALIEGNFILLRERILREVHDHVYVGLNLDLQHLGSARYIPNAGFEDRVAPLGATGGTNLGLGLGVIYDTRHNPLNVRDGLMAEVGLLAYPALTSSYPMAAAYVDGRIYFPINATHVFGAQIRGDFAFGDVPFNQLSQLGGPMMMRGYYTGRFRDRNAVSAQIEYRILPLWWRLGVAAFASVGSVAPDLGFKQWDWSVGGGPRFLLFPLKDIYMRIDFGFNAERWGTYFYIGESF